MLCETIIFLVFLAGLLFCLQPKKTKTKEAFSIAENCPNVLVQKGNELLLFNNKKAKIPGVNPIRFNNLNEYVEFMQWQRGVGIRCPVLYFQQTYDVQNNLGWRSLNSPTDPRAGTLVAQETPLIDANTLEPPFNIGDYPGYDPDNQYIGDYTPLDKIFAEGGAAVNTHVDQGYYYTQQKDYMNQSPDRSRGRHFSSFAQYDKSLDRNTEWINKHYKEASSSKSTSPSPKLGPGANSPPPPSRPNKIPGATKKK